MRKIVIDLIVEFLEEKNKRIFFNENEFQRYLACYLEQKLGVGYDIYTEYQLTLPIPKPQIFKKELKGKYLKEHTISIDIVVVKDNNLFMPIELKYKTDETTIEEHKVFGRYTKVITNQKLVNSGRVHYWMDVQRIEHIKKEFPNSVLGVAVILANKKGYWAKPTDKVPFSTFGLHDRTISQGESLKWDKEVDGKAVDCVVDIPRDIKIEWTEITMQRKEFKYLILPNEE